MKRISFLLILFGAMSLLLHDDLVARGPGGGGRVGGGGGARVGGGAAAAARPATGAGRSPALGGGNVGAARPSVGAGASRPNVGSGAARPSVGDIGASRPNIGAGSGDRPAIGDVGAARPGVGAGAIGARERPSASQLNNFLDIPRASTGAVGVAGGGNVIGRGGAAADFLNGGGARPATLPAGGIANRPGIERRGSPAELRRQSAQPH